MKDSQYSQGGSDDQKYYVLEKENTRVDYSVQEEGKILNPVDFEYMDSCYKTFLSSVANDQVFSQVDSDMKIRILVENLSHPKDEISLGALIFLFEIVYGYRESLSESAIELILTEIFYFIPLFYEKKSYYLVLASLEVVGKKKKILNIKNKSKIKYLCLKNSIPRSYWTSQYFFLKHNTSGFYFAG